MKALTRKNLLGLGGYASFFCSCFVLFAVLGFPYERVRDLLISRAEASSAPGTKLRIGDLGPHWLTGVTLRNVRLEKPAAEPDGQPSHIAIDKLTLSAAPFTLLFGGMGVHFDAVAGSGEVVGSYSAKKDGPAHVQAELDALDLDTLALGAALGIPLRGAATGTIDLTLSALAAETVGSIDLRIESLQLGDGKTKIKVPGLPGGITLEAIHAGTLEMKLEVKEGVATISRLEAKGKDIELSGSGSLRVSQTFPDSIADVTLGVKVKDAYAKRNDRTKAMVELMNINLSRFAGADGMIRFHIMGPLSSPRTMPTGPGAAPPTGRKGRKRGG